MQIIRYANRLEICNPGHSLVPDDRLGEPGSVTRNEKIAAVLHETGYAETKGSGIRSMRQAMTQAGLSLPTFESDREKDSFVVTFLFHHFLNAEDVEWLGRFSELNLSEDEHKALVYARELGAINNASYRDINRMDTLVASSRLRHLRGLGLLEQKGKSVNTYYIPTAAMLSPRAEVKSGAEPEVALSPKFDPYVQSLSTELNPYVQSLGTELGEQPQGSPVGTPEKAKKIGKRASPEQLREAIRAVCCVTPLSLKELSNKLGRKPDYLRRQVRSMVAERELFYMYPDNPMDPRQKYMARKP